MSRFFTFLKKEILEMLPPTLFFLVVFHLVVFTRALMDDSPGASLFSSTAATIGALIMGKSILIADALPVWYLLERQRMIYLVVSRTVCYALIALLFQFLEELIPLARSAGSVGAGLARLWEEIHWHRFWGHTYHDPDFSGVL